MHSTIPVQKVPTHGSIGDIVGSCNLGEIQTAIFMIILYKRCAKRRSSAVLREPRFAIVMDGPSRWIN